MGTEAEKSMSKQFSEMKACVLLTVSLFMKPQIAAATSQAKRITKKKKN